MTRSTEGPIRRTSYARTRERALRIAQRLARDGMRAGDRIGTLAWNTDRHLELWYGITGMGGVCHTLNPRLFEDQLAWIANHAEDRMLFLDIGFAPLVERLAPRIPSIERYVLLCAEADMPQTSLRGAVAFESWLAEADGDVAWAEVDEKRRPGCATPLAPRAIPRACSIRTDPTCCTP